VFDKLAGDRRQALTAWTYQHGPARYYQPAYFHLASAIGLESGAFLDVGCGPGWLAIQVASGKPELDAVGIDTSPAMLRFAQRNRGPRLNVSFREMDASTIVFPEATFDAAAAVQSAHHWADTAGVLSEVHRVLKPGGAFYVYEADSEATEVPEGWIHREGAWPPDAWVRRAWRRYGMDQADWEALKTAVSASPFGGGEDGRHGFYRRLVLRK